ncbi:MAG: hypothetical protein JXR07_02785 [Reichenbachiella sp.]
MRTSEYIISFLFLVLIQDLNAQESLEAPRDWKPSLLFLSSDVVGLIDMASGGDTQAEFSAKMDFDQLFLAFDFGFENSHLSNGTSFDYTSEGRFFRVGPQINFMKYEKSRTNIFFGLMYANSKLNDQISYTVPEGAWEANELSYSNNNFKAQWFEANVGISVRIVGPLFLGYTIRFKLAKWMDTPEDLMPYSIPGFGPADKASNFGFNYYLTYRLGFRKKKIPDKPKNQKKRLEKVPTNEIETE